MTDPSQLPRRYFVNASGQRVLIGLSIEETFEFESFDILPSLNAGGNHAAWDRDGVPATTPERRWLELYRKHDQAWRQWLVETSADRRANLAFIN